MPNPMMQALLGGGKNRPNNPLALLREFRKFAQNVSPEKAEEEIGRLLSSGRMTKEQFEELKDDAKWIMQFLKK